MKELMRYTIRSGNVLEKRDVLMEVGRDENGRRKPRGKYRGVTLAAQVERNMRETVLELARVLNCNFRRGDLRITFNFSDGRLPESLDEVHRVVYNALRNICRAHKRATGEKLRWVLVPSDTDPETGETVRLHAHVWLTRVDEALVRKYWPEGELYIDHVDGRRDHLAGALYLIKNSGYKRRRRNWSTSQGMVKPVYSRPVPVATAGSFQTPKGAVSAKVEISTNQGDGFWAAYGRYILAEETVERPAIPNRPRRTGAGATSIRNPGDGGGKNGV